MVTFTTAASGIVILEVSAAFCAFIAGLLVRSCPAVRPTRVLNDSGSSRSHGEGHPDTGDLDRCHEGHSRPLQLSLVDWLDRKWRSHKKISSGKRTSARTLTLPRQNDAMSPNAGSAPSLTEVMEQHPQLNSFGIGAYDARSKTPEQRDAETVERRSELLRREPIVMQLVEWLDRNVSSIQTPTQDSYSVKGLIERSRGEYITNGELIAAALIAGYPHKYAVPNVLFGMSQRDLNRARIAH